MGAMLFGISNEGIFAYAMTNQSVTAASGYRIYADSLTSASGVIKGDVSELQPDYKVSHVVLPDGNTSAAEEVSYSITESGDYTFEVVYEAVPEDKQVKINLDLASLQGKETTEEKISEKAEPEENVQSEKSQDTTSEIPITEETEIDSTAIEKAAKEAKEASKSEKLTLTVTLPEAEEKADASAETTAEQEATQTEGSISSQPLTSFVPSTLSNASQSTSPSTRSVMSESNSRASLGGYDYNSQKKWSTSDFTTQWMTASTWAMNYGQNPPPDTVQFTNVKSGNNSNGAFFRFGKQIGTTSSEAAWLQQGAAFSDITFDFTKSFALVGYMHVGDSFAGTVDGIDDINLQIDGGLTISFVPTGQIGTARKNAEGAMGAAYRLGAYGTLPNSIVCEFDTSTDDYYDIGDKRNFVISKGDIQKTGDYYYHSTKGAFNEVKGGDIFDLAKMVKDGGKGYQNIRHIGISMTGSDGFVSSSSNTSPRVAMGTESKRTLRYEIQYDGSSQTITFSIKEYAGDVVLKDISLNVSSLLSKVPDKKMNLVFTYGAAYLNISNYIQAGTGYFSDATTNGGSGQIDIFAKELYVNPDLKITDTKIKWLANPTGVVQDNGTNVAYNNGTDYSNRQYWPVAGDRIYAQFSFVPSTDIMPQPSSTQRGTLKLRVADLKITDENGTEIQGLKIGSTSLYIRNNNNNIPTWTTYNSSSGISISGKSAIDVRVQLNLPQLDVGSSYTGYRVSGNIYGDFTVGGSNATYQVSLMTVNNKYISVSRNPMFINFNGVNYYDNVRIVKTSDNISELKNITNGGNKNAKGDKTSLHFGAGYRPMSNADYYPMYQDRSGTGTNQYDVDQVNIKSATMDNLSTVTTETNVQYNKSYSVDMSKDTRYIIEYSINDSVYSSKPSNLTNNASRGQATGKRIIWTSDNVQVKNNLEFYALSVTMTKEDFKGFDPNGNNNAPFYQNIAKNASAKLFRTSDYNFTNLLNGNYSIVSGIGAAGHQKVQQALNTPGTQVEVPLQITLDGKNVQFNVKLTIADSTPKIVSNGENNSITNQSATKIIFDKENYTVSATFKLANADNTSIDLSQLKWDDVKDKIKVALYKKNGPQSQASKDKYYRWANKSEATNNGKTGTNTKLDLPVVLKYNNNGTFTVTYTLLNNNTSTPDENWVQKRWEDGAEWKILAWTDSNKPSKDYSKLDDSSTDNIAINEILADVPTVTTTIELIEKNSGNLPQTMFTISNVQLNDGGNELSDKRNTTTVSLESTGEVSEQAFKSAQHDYYYEVRVNESNNDSQSRPYSTLTQKSTKKTINATYLKYISNTNSYSDIVNTDTLLGSIAYPSNKSLPQSIRFGMRADKPTNIASDEDFLGLTSFKFVRKSLSGGANP